MPDDRKAGSQTPFLTDVATLRKRARQQMQAGAVTQNYGADPKVVIELLNAALATEIVCVLRYKRHYFMAQGIASESVKTEFAEHATQEQEHADRIAERIVQLGGEPDLNPDTPHEAQPFRIRGGHLAGRHAARGSRGRAGGDRKLPRDRSTGCTARIPPPNGCWKRSSPWRKSTRRTSIPCCPA